MRNKIRFGILVLMSVLLFGAAMGQGLENYRFTTGTNGYLYSPTFTDLIGSGVDDGCSEVLDIGFTFTYDGVNYTKFSVNTNGRLRLGSEVISGEYQIPFQSGYYMANAPKIVAFGKDCGTGAAGYVKTGLYDTENCIVRVVECQSSLSNNEDDETYLKYQIQLFKGSNEIRIVYSGDFTYEPSSYQVGIGNADGNKFWYVDPSTHTATYSTTYLTANYSGYPGARRFYSFAPDPTITAADAASVAYSCDFEKNSENSKWSFGNAIDGWYIGSAVSNGGSKSLYVSNDGGTTNAYGSAYQYIYAFRKIELNANSYLVSFDWKCNGESSYDFLRAYLVPESLSPDFIGRSGSNGNLPNNIGQNTVPSGWIALDGGTRLDSQTEWQTQSQTVSVTTSGTYYLVFHWRSDVSEQGGDYNPPAAIDNILVKYAPTSIPYACDFENSSENAAWTFANGSSNYWMIGNSTYSSSSNSLYITYNGSAYAYNNYSGSSYIYAYRNMNFTSAGDYVVSFKWKAMASVNDFLRAFLVPVSVPITAGRTNDITSTNTPSGWIAVDGGSGLHLQSSWQVCSHTVSIETAGEYNLVFYWYNGTSGAQPPAAVDDIEVVAPCQASATLSASVQGCNSVEITRTSGDGLLYEILVSASSDIASATETPVLMNSESQIVAGLIPDTQYYAYIRGNCSEYNYGEWSEPVGFVTEDALFSLPYHEDFEDGAFDGWVSNAINNGWYVGSATANGGDYSMYISSDKGVSNVYNTNKTSYSYAYCKLNIDEPCIINVSFDWKCNGDQNRDLLRPFLIPARLNPNLTAGVPNGMGSYYNTAPSGWIDVSQNALLNLSSEWQNSSMDVMLLETGEYYLVFFWKNSPSSGVQPPAAVDNISVELVSNCLPVKNIRTVSRGKTWASVSWTPQSNETQWQVLVSTAYEVSDATETPVLVDNANPTIYNLTPDTRYYIHVRPYCSESEQGDWVRGASSFTTLMPCPVVSNLSVVEIASNSVGLSWTSSDVEATQWQVLVSTSSDLSYATEDIVLVDNTAPTISGLTPNTHYYVYVRSDCGEFGTSQWVANVAFTTSPEPVGLPYSENFEDGLPSGWVTLNKGTNGWYAGTATSSEGSRSLYVSNNGGAYNRYDITSNSYSAAYLAINVEQASVVRVLYDWKNVGESGYDYLRAFVVPSSVNLDAYGSGVVSTGAPDGWKAADNGYMSGSSSWTTMTKDVTLEQGLYYVLFYWQNDGSLGEQPPAAIDNLSVSVLTTCIYEGVVSISDIGKTTATASWSEYDGISQWEVLVTTASDPDEASETPVLVDNNTYNISGIVPGTQYYVYVRGYCSESSKGIWYGTDFTTLPSCLPVEDVSVADIGKTNVALSFTDVEGASLWEVLATTASNPDEATESPVLVDNTSPTITGLTPDTYYRAYVRTYCSETDQSAWVSSNIFTTLPACLQVEDVSVDNYDKTSVTLSWTNTDSDATQWEVLVSTSSEPSLATEEPVFVDNTNPTITGLTPDTYYYVYVSTYCSETAHSAWTLGGNFTTLPACLPVENVAVDSYGKTWVTASWTNTDDDASQWEVLVTTESDPSLATESPVFVNTTSATVENLEMNTMYRVYVRSYCSESAQSTWVASSSFTTYPPCVPPTNISAVVNSDSVHFTWTHDYNLSTYHLYLSDTEMSETELNALTSSEYETETYLSHNYTGLTEGHTYHFYIRDVCVEGDYSDWAHFPFTTPTDEVMPLPYYQDFESDIVENWHLNNDNINSSWYFGTATAMNSDKSLYISGNTRGAQWLAQNGVSYSYAYCRLQVDQPCVANVTFDLHGGFSSSSYLSLRAFMIPTSLSPALGAGEMNGMSGSVNTTPDGWISVFDNWTMYDGSSWAYSSKDVILSESGEYYFVFLSKCYGSSMQNPPFAVDNLSVEVVSTCIYPQNVSLDSYGKTTATLSWERVTDESQWQVLATTADSPEEATETPILVDATTATVSNLEMNTDYNVFVRTYCSESNQSSWSSAVSFTTLPPCAAPYNLYALLTPTTATVRWLHEYRRLPYHIVFSETTKTDEELASSLYQPYNFENYYWSNLTPGATYHVYVAAECGDDEMSDWAHIEFTTPELEAMPLPYYQDFEDGVIENWAVSNQNNGWYLGSAIANESSMSLYVSPDYGSTYYYDAYNSISYAYCRLNVDHPSIINVSYDWTGEGSGVGNNMRTLLVPVSLNPNLSAGVRNGISAYTNHVYAPDEWIELGTPYPVQCQHFNPGSASSWLRSSKDVTVGVAGDYYLVFFWENDNYNGSHLSAAVDNISVTTVSDCVFYGDVAVDNITRTSADISWTTVGPATQWQIIVSQSDNVDDALANGNPVLVSETSYTATGLDENTTYYTYVRSYCSESDVSQWFAGPSFTTYPPCQPPYDIFATLTSTSVSLEWKQPYEYNSFNIYISQSEMTDEQLNEAPYTNVTELTYEESGLEPGQLYHAYISSGCANAEQSEWTVLDFYMPESDLVTLPYYQNFDGTSVENWNFNNQTNAWIIGGDVDENGGKSLYISDDNENNYYNAYWTSYSYAYVKFNVDKRTIVNVSFDWKGYGEGYWDCFKALAVPSLLNPVFSGDNGMNGSSTSVPSGWIEVSEFLSGEYEWQHFSQDVELPEADDYYLVFFWKNDSYSGENPPAAIDNISVVPLSDENDIVEFMFAGAENIVIDAESHTVTCDVPYSWNLEQVKPMVVVSQAATITPESNTYINLSTPFTYIVTSESGLTQEWTVTANRMAAVSNAEILSFNTDGQMSCTINSENATVDATISRMYDITSLVPSIGISYLASINHVNGTAYDFTNPIVFTVTAEDQTTKDWTVSVTYDDVPLGADCSNPYIVDAENDLPYSHTSSTAGLFNMYNTYNSDNPSSILYVSGNEAVYRVDLPYRMMLDITVTSSPEPFAFFVMNSCGTLASYMVDSRRDVFDSETMTIDLPSGSFYVVIDSYSEADIDYEIQIERLPYCYVVNDLEATRLQTELNVAWSSDNVGDSWVLKYGLSGFDVETEGTEVVLDETNYTITGLQESTIYDIYVRANCNAFGLSEWSQISASTISSCQVPEELALVEITDIDANLSWQGFNMTQWEVQYKEQSDSEYATLTVDEPSVTLTGLQYSTIYNVRVRSVCDNDTYSDYAEIEITTECGIIREFPFAENFDGDAFPPECWSQERTAVGSGVGLSYVNGAWTRSASSAGDNTTPKAMLSDTKAGSVHNLVTLGLMFVESLNGYDISLDVYRSSSSVASSAEGVEIWVNTSPDIINGNPQMLGYISKNFQTESAGVVAEREAGWYTYSFNTRDRVGVNYVIIVGKANNAGGVYVDNLVVEKTVDCLAPSNLLVESVGEDSVALSWSDANAIQGTWTVRYSLNGDDEVETSVDEPQLTIAGLQPGTAYNISAEIQGVCALGMESEWYDATVEVVTDCSPLDLPYTQNFAIDDGTLPDCWKLASDGSQTWSVANETANIQATGGQVNAHLLSPSFNFSADTKYLLEFDVRRSSLSLSRSDTLYVLFAGQNVDTLESVALQNASQNVMERISVVLPQNYSGSARIDFAYSGLRGCSVDSIIVRSMSHEADILSFEVEGLTNVEIDAEAAEVNASVVYGTNVANLNTIFTISQAATASIVSGEWYDFRSPMNVTVTAEDGTEKEWTITVSVDENSCPNPTADDITLAVAVDSVVVTISQVHNETSYNMIVSSQPIDPETETGDVFVGGVENVSTVTGLQANTYYYIYVQSNCGAAGWTQIGFSTNCGALELPYAQDFTGSSLPDCWSVTDANADGKTWNLVGGEMVYSFSRTNNADDYLTSPMLSIVQNAKLRFDYRVGNYSYPEKFSVYAVDGADTVRLASMVVRNETAQTYGPLDLSAYAGRDVRIMIKCESDAYRYRLYVDNFNVSVSGYVVETSVVGNGSISPDGTVEVATGEDVEFTLVPDAHNELISLVLDGNDVTADIVDGTYTLIDIHEPHSLLATFTERYVLTASSTDGGSIEPEGEMIIEGGESQRFVFIPDEGYRLGNVIVDGELVEVDNFMYVFDDIRANHNIQVSFNSIIYYVVNATAGENGSVTPSGRVEVEEGGSLTITAVPDDGYIVDAFMVDGVDVIGELVDNSYTLTNITSRHNVNVTFEEYAFYTITASSGDNGSILPEGEITVASGDDMSFRIVPYGGYHIASVTVDEVDVTGELSGDVYVFHEVRGDHTIHAEFAINTYNILAYAQGGTITPSGTTTVNHGESLTFEFEPNFEYELSNVFVDNRSVETDGNTYTFDSITRNHNIVVVFTPMNITRYTINAVAQEHGSISPSGNVRVVEGDDQTFEIAPDEHYYISSVVVDGEPVEVVDEYTFEDVADNHSIEVSFEAYKHIITAEAGENGSISPSGEVEVDEGSDFTFTLSPNVGYRVASVFVDGESVEFEGNSYTMENILADHSLLVEFELLPLWTITAVSSANGSLSPEGTRYVLDGDDIEFDILPDEGYMVDRIVVDGVAVAYSGGAYVFENVRSDHYIYVSFRPLMYVITATTDGNGDVSPIGTVEVEPGANKLFRFVPFVGYMVDSIYVDGEVVAVGESRYEFTDIDSDHTLYVTFVHISVGVEDSEAMSASLYPNPNDGRFLVDFAGISGEVVYQLVDASGAVVDVRNLYVDEGSTIEFYHNLKPGVYFARFISGDRVYVERFVVE